MVKDSHKKFITVPRVRLHTTGSVIFGIVIDIVSIFYNTKKQVGGLFQIQTEVYSRTQKMDPKNFNFLKIIFKMTPSWKWANLSELLALNISTKLLKVTLLVLPKIIVTIWP